MRSSEDTSVYDKVVNSIFDEDVLRVKNQHQIPGSIELDSSMGSYSQYTEFSAELRTHVVEVTNEVFRQHCGKHLEFNPMRMLDDSSHFNRSFSSFNTFELVSFQLVNLSVLVDQEYCQSFV